MNLIDAMHKAADHVSTMRAAFTGGVGATVSLAAATADPGSIEPWLRIATLCVGLVTGLGSGGLVALKYIDLWRGRRIE